MKPCAGLRALAHRKDCWLSKALRPGVTTQFPNAERGQCLAPGSLVARTRAKSPKCCDSQHGGPSIAINDEASRRRSLYFVHSHNDQQKFLSTFDDANVLDCYRRAESIVPQQALALENSPLVTTLADKIAQRLAAAHPNAPDAEFLRAAFVTLLSVEPTADEQAAMSEVLQRLAALARAKGRPNPEILARTSLIQTLINHNDFITIR